MARPPTPSPRSEAPATALSSWGAGSPLAGRSWPTNPTRKMTKSCKILGVHWDHTRNDPLGFYFLTLFSIFPSGSPLLFIYIQEIIYYKGKSHEMQYKHWHFGMSFEKMGWQKYFFARFFSFHFLLRYVGIIKAELATSNESPEEGSPINLHHRPADYSQTMYSST